MSIANRRLKYLKKILILVTIHFIFCNATYADFFVSLRSPESKEDKREEYNYALVILALEKTKVEYGDYRILEIPPMNIARSIYSLEMDAYPNLLLELSYEEKYENQSELIYIDFPIDLGITGYRVCFVNPKIKDIIKNTNELGRLKEYSIGQGFSWADTEILRYNGFTIVEISNYLSIFKMVEYGRIDLFCRGANELQHEYESFKNDGNLIYDDSFVLYYPLPRFYYLNKNSLLAQERIKKGLIAAHQDGSLMKLWLEKFQGSVDFAQLKKRKLYKLENPLIKSLSTTYEQYFYDPLR